MRRTSFVLLFIMALVFTGCMSPGADELKKSQKREADQLHAEGAPAEEKPDAKDDAAKDDAAKDDAAKEDAGKDDAAKDDAAKEDAGKDDAAKDDAGKEDAAEYDPASKDLFASTCGGCHVLGDAGTAGTAGPDLDGTSLSAEEIAAQIENGSGTMPGGMLTGSDAEGVAAYIAAVAGK